MNNFIWSDVAFSSIASDLIYMYLSIKLIGKENVNKLLNGDIPTHSNYICYLI